MKNGVRGFSVFAFGVLVAVMGAPEARAIPRDKILLESEPGSHDRAEDLVDQMRWTRLDAIENAHATMGELPVQPWSDTYWPLYSGVIAQRYADPDFPGSGDWKTNADYLLQALGGGASDRLSPAEKYDLMIGDRSFPLSRRMINEGKAIYMSEGKVERWMGICHGWAPASFMMDRPLHSVTVRNREGKEIVFLPADLRALASVLWANGDAPTRFVGGRCNESDPASDGSGRPRNEECVDTNPGTFHLALVNQITGSGRSFIMDANYDYEVWNQPIVGYSYQLYNVITGAPAAGVSEAKVKLADYVNDPRKHFRSPHARFIVGVQMKVNYMVENRPLPFTVASPQDDRRNSVQYTYDLELDENDEIIGGEWEGRQHPDFLWVPKLGATVSTPGDRALASAGDRASWKSADFPERWSGAAKVSAEQGMPLARIVYELIARSQE